MKALQIFRRTAELYLQNAAKPLQRNLSTIPRRSFQIEPFTRQESSLQLLSKITRRKRANHLPSKRFNSTKPPFNPTPDLGSPEPSLSLAQRLRKLSREYGWSALGVYLALTALDFPFCFLAVRWLGTDRIGHWEHMIMDWFWSVVPYPFPPKDEPQAVEIASVGTKVEEYGTVDPQNSEVGIPGYDHGVKEADERNKSENASIWTQLALAYAIHKSFIFIRVPLTAAVTPKVVKVLRGWGWDVGKRKPKGPSGVKKG